MIRETPVFFHSRGNQLFGVLTEPRGGSISQPVVVLMHEASPGGMAVQGAVLPRMARKLAQAGRMSFRFDFHGTGDSAGPTPQVVYPDPFCADLDAALDWLGGIGATRFVFAGSCLGALVAASAASRRTDVSALALLSCHFTSDRDERVLRRARNVLRDLRIVTAREVPVLFLYGEPDTVYAEFRAARESADGDPLKAASVSTDVLSGRVHAFLDVDLQERVIARVVDWAEAVAFRSDSDVLVADRPRAQAWREG